MTLKPETASINRRNGERANTVQGWIRPTALLIEVAAEGRRRIAAEGFTLDPGYRLEVTGNLVGEPNLTPPTCRCSMALTILMQ